VIDIMRTHPLVIQNGRIEGTVKPNPRTTIQLQGPFEATV
jgi:hypothetical protein